jgi:hypothetical protein
MFSTPLSETYFILRITERDKGKADPLQAWSGPEGSRKLRFPDYMTTSQDCDKVIERDSFQRCILVFM